MQIVCPCCFARFSVETALQDADGRRLIALLAPLGPVAGDALAYLGLFRARARALAWSRALRLAEPLVADMQAEALRRRGREWVVTAEMWRDAFAVLTARRDEGKLRTPLKSHGYLYEVLVGLADAAEGEAERQREEALRAQRRERPAPALDADTSDDEIRHIADAARNTIRNFVATHKSRYEHD